MADGILNPIEQLEAEFDFDVYTKQEVDALLDEKADADSVYTKTETDTLLDGKADKSTTLAGYGITDAYTKTQTDNLLSAKANADSVYTKAEIDTELTVTKDGTWVKGTQTTATNLQKLEGGLEYAYAILSKQYDQLKKYINGNYYDYDTDNDSKYVKTVPNGAMPYASLDSIGGKTLLWNQLVKNDTATQTINDVTFTNNGDGTWTLSGTASADASKSVNVAFQTITNHKYFLRGCPSGGSTNTYWLSFNGSFPGGNSETGTGAILTATADNIYGFASIRIKSGVNTNGLVFKPQLSDLTLMYGAGNEPTTVAEFQQQFPADYYAFTQGTLLSAGVTEVVSKKADTTTIATYSIPAEVQALEGYGWSAGSVYNYVDFERKVYVQQVGKVILDGTQQSVSYNFSSPQCRCSYKVSGIKTISTSGSTVDEDIISDYLTNGSNSEAQSGILCVYRRPNGSEEIFVSLGSLGISAGIASATDFSTYLSIHPLTVYYPLATPIETDISAYLTDDNLISVEAGGRLTFPNSNGDDYRIDVPSSETYMVDLQSALGE